MARSRIEVHAEVIEEQRKRLEAAMTVSPEMNKRLREDIFQEMKAARDRIVSHIKFKNGDPRHTAHAVKRYVARKYLGGVISIASGGKGGAPNDYEPPRKVYPGPGGKRGGNRMIRSKRTDDIMHTGDRDFILRFVNAGTHPRYAAGRNLTGKSNRRALYRMQEEGDWYRGSIAPRGFFKQYGQLSLDLAVKNISEAIDDAFNRLFKG